MHLPYSLKNSQKLHPVILLLLACIAYSFIMIMIMITEKHSLQNWYIQTSS